MFHFFLWTFQFHIQIQVQVQVQVQIQMQLQVRSKWTRGEWQKQSCWDFERDRLAAVVPAPPWCTAAQHCGRSQSCGQSSNSMTVSGRSNPSPSPAQPLKDADVSTAHCRDDAMTKHPHKHCSPSDQYRWDKCISSWHSDTGWMSLSCMTQRSPLQVKLAMLHQPSSKDQHWQNTYIWRWACNMTDIVVLLFSMAIDW